MTRSKACRCWAEGNDVPWLGGHRCQQGERRQLHLSGWHWRQLLSQVTLLHTTTFCLWHTCPPQVLAYNLQVQGARSISRLERAWYCDQLPRNWAHPREISRPCIRLRSYGSRPFQRRHPALHQEPRAPRVQGVQGAPRLRRPQDPRACDHPALQAGHWGRHLPIRGHPSLDQLRGRVELEQARCSAMGRLP